MKRFHRSETMGLLFHFNFEMESDFFVFQRVFVCFVIRLVPYSFTSLSRRCTSYGSCQMLKSGNKSEKNIAIEFENDSNHNKNNRLRR